MKKLVYMGLLLTLIVATACNGNKSAEESKTRVVLKDSVDAQGVQRMQSFKAEQTITFNNREYHSLLHRVSCDSLARVRDSRGDVFVDNTITLRLTRGTEKIFGKTFTKRDFAAWIGADFMKSGILEGMVFDKTTPQGFVYAVSVAYPQSDLYIPLSVTISSNGTMSIAKEELMEDIYTDEE